MIDTINCYKRVGVILFVSLTIAAVSAEADDLYRYRNVQGNIVIDHEIPPKYTAGGYEILSETGRVLQVIEPQQNPEELDVEQQQNELAKIAEQLREDQMLLRTYNVVSELVSAKDRRLAQLKREIEIIESNFAKNEAAFEVSRTSAANYQLSGKPVPKTLLKSMDEQILQRRDAEQMLLLRQQEYQGTEDRYMGYLARFKTLKGFTPPETDSPEKNQP
jgi:hypothetical protein